MQQQIRTAKTTKANQPKRVVITGGSATIHVVDMMDDDDRIRPPSYYDRIVDVMEELVRFAS